VHTRPPRVAAGTFRLVVSGILPKTLLFFDVSASYPPVWIIPFSLQCWSMLRQEMAAPSVIPAPHADSYSSAHAITPIENQAGLADDGLDIEI